MASRPLTHIQFWPQANDPGDRSDQENVDIVSSDTANPQQPDPEDTATAKLSRKRRRNRNQDKARLSLLPLPLQINSSTTTDSMTTIPVHHRKMNCGFLKSLGNFTSIRCGNSLSLVLLVARSRQVYIELVVEALLSCLST